MLAAVAIWVPGVAAQGVAGQYVGQGEADFVCHEDGTDPSEDVVCEDTHLDIVVNYDGSGAAYVSLSIYHPPGSGPCTVPNPGSFPVTGTPESGFHGTGTLACIGYDLSLGPLTSSSSSLSGDFDDTCGEAHLITSLEGFASFGAPGVPTLSEWSFVLLGGVLLSTGTVVVVRRRR